MDRLNRWGAAARYPGGAADATSDDIAMAELAAAAVHHHVASEFARGGLMPDGHRTIARATATKRNVPLLADGHAAAAVGTYPALGDRPALGGSARGTPERERIHDAPTVLVRGPIRGGGVAPIPPGGGGRAKQE